MMRGAPVPDALTGTKMTSPMSGRPAEPWLKISATIPPAAEVICCTAGSEPSGSPAAAAPSSTVVSEAGARPPTVSSRSWSPPRNSLVLGAPPGGNGVPCSIDGAVRATADGAARALGRGGWWEPARIRWMAAALTMSTAAVTPAISRPGRPRRRSRSRPPLITSETGSSGTRPTYSWHGREPAGLRRGSLTGGRPRWSSPRRGHCGAMNSAQPVRLS